MALIPCPDCGIDVSDQAAVCKNCGLPVVAHMQKLKEEEEARLAEIAAEKERAWQEKQREITITVLVIIGIIIFLVIASHSGGIR